MAGGGGVAVAHACNGLRQTGIHQNSTIHSAICKSCTNWSRGAIVVRHQDHLEDVVTRNKHLTSDSGV